MPIRFHLTYPTVWGQTLRIVGSAPELGQWNPAEAPEMLPDGDGHWYCEQAIAPTADKVEYKFCLLTPPLPWHPQATVRWEAGDNHTLIIRDDADAACLTFDHPVFQEENPLWKCAGLALPVFSIRSRRSFGIGDFSDLLPLIDWAKITGQRLIQLLPINDTTYAHTWHDSYPYNAISVYALHPLYIDLNGMGTLRDPARRALYQQKQQALNALPAVDYEAVDHWKWQFFRELFSEAKDETLFATDYIAFCETHQDWLQPYAAYCCRRDASDTPELYCFVQYHAHRQMAFAHDYARRQGIVLKGDIPIGVHADGVDATLTDPGLFNRTVRAGAPPDAFSADGQIWGFPTYRWPAMEAENYRWWKKRFAHIATYFDAYRIDHILGFFRIWQIPAEQNSGLGGYFYPALPLSAAEIAQAGLSLDRIKGLLIEAPAQQYHPHIAAATLPPYQQLDDTEKQRFNHLYDDYFYHRHNTFWKQQALAHLAPLIHATGMLPCGEDLGMIPATVPEVMEQLQILSLEIERMPKSPGREFTDWQQAPYRSVCTTSTHDMPTLRGWWAEDREKTQRYYNGPLNLPGAAPEDCTPALCRRILQRHLHAPSMLAIFPLQDWLSIDELRRAPDADAERINVPAHSRHYWRYRMHLYIEDLLVADDLNEGIRGLIRESGRD
jgi:4-alpha-glucanotransferase